MVSTAVRFLENAKVNGTSLELKKTFLKKKGLTEEEIAIAFKQARPQPDEAGVTETRAPHQYPPVYETSLGARLRDFLNVLLLIGGFSYAVRYLWKKYLRRWIFGESDESNPMKVVQKSNQQLLEAVASLQQGMQRLQERLAEVKEREVEEVTDLKKEVQSVKGLLLSSRSFPQQPSPPSIPAWQLPTPTTNTNKDKEGTKTAVVEEAGSWEGSTSSEIEIIQHEQGSEEGTVEDNPPALVLDNQVPSLNEAAAPDNEASSRVHETAAQDITRRILDEAAADDELD